MTTENSVIAEKGRFYARSRDSGIAQSLSVQWAVVPLFLLDGVCIALSMWAAYLVRFQLLDYHAAFSPRFYAYLVAGAVFAWEVIFAFHKLYDAEYLFGGVQEYGRVVNGCTVGLVALILYSFMDRRWEHDISRGWLAIGWCFAVVIVVMVRFCYRRVIYRFRERGVFVRRALIIGANQEAREVGAQLSCVPCEGLEVVGLIAPELVPGTAFGGMPVLGDLSDLRTLIQRRGVEELIVIPTALDRETLLRIYQEWGVDDSVQIRLSSGLYELFTTGIRVREVGFVPLLSLDRTRITGISAWTKMALDYALALVGVVFLAPVFLALAILIKLGSPGLAIHRRRVVGMHGKIFDAFKFRTMIVDADAYLEEHPELKREWETSGKIQDDPRITKIGQVLRRFSLDELPQLFNVLRGEMSLVGPRMITPEEQEHFGHWQHNRLTVKPGLTGLWQVNGRSDLPYEDRARLDMYYVRNYTIWLDLKLIFNTVSVVLKGRGAY